MPRLCVIVPGMPTDEDEWFLPYLVAWLRRLHAQADLHVYALKHPGTATSYSVHGIPVTSFHQRWIRLQTTLMNAVLADHQERPFTHVHAVWANTAGFFGAMVARNLKLPFAVTMGGEELVNLPAIKYGAMRKWRTKPILRYVFSTADIINAPSSGTRFKLLQKWGVPESKIRSIPFGVDTDLFTPAPTPLPGPLHVLAVGGLIPVKQHALLLEAFAQVRTSIPDARLTIVGDGPLLESLKKKASLFGVANAVGFPGWVHHDKLPDMYRTAHLLAVSSHHEEIPVCMLEALSSGLRVVTTNVGIAYDLQEDGQYPVSIVEPNAEQFAEGIIASWKDMQHQPGAAITEEARNALSVDTTVEQTLGLYSAIKR